MLLTKPDAYRCKNYIPAKEKDSSTRHPFKFHRTGETSEYLSRSSDGIKNFQSQKKATSFATLVTRT